MSTNPSLPQERIVLARIDNRLIHGQVLEAWVPFVQADCIVVASDEVAAKPLQKKLMAAAVPREISVIIGGLAEIAEFFSRNDSARRVLLLFPSPAAALQGYRLGIPLAELNLGNLPGGDGKRRVSCTLSFSEDDLSIFQQLEAGGVKILARCLPSDDPLDWKVLAAGGEG
ncbi:MAG: PTS sugar transporter subunit IIB [Desulfuromonadales bacterium]|nr:PTS sugar transporter subunit IIB [Desulfuromonadales bacterium]